MLSRNKSIIHPIAILVAGLAPSFAVAQSSVDTDAILRDLRSTDKALRTATARSLVSLAILSRDGDRVIHDNLKFLVQIVQDKDEVAETRADVVRAIAAASSRRLVDQSIVPAFTKILLDETEAERVRGRIAVSLPSLTTPDSAAPSILAASRSANNNVRVNAAQQ